MEEQIPPERIGTASVSSPWRECEPATCVCVACNAATRKVQSDGSPIQPAHQSAWRLWCAIPALLPQTKKLFTVQPTQLFVP